MSVFDIRISIIVIKVHSTCSLFSFDIWILNKRSKRKYYSSEVRTPSPHISWIKIVNPWHATITQRKPNSLEAEIYFKIHSRVSFYGRRGYFSCKWIETIFTHTHRKSIYIGLVMNNIQLVQSCGKEIWITFYFYIKVLTHIQWDFLRLKHALEFCMVFPLKI